MVMPGCPVETGASSDRDNSTTGQRPYEEYEQSDAVLSRRDRLDAASAIPEVGGRPGLPWSTAAFGALILGRGHTAARQPRRL